MSEYRSYTVYVEVVVTAQSPHQARNRVEKALVCLDNSLRYADGASEVTEVETEKVRP